MISSMFSWLLAACILMGILNSSLSFLLAPLVLGLAPATPTQLPGRMSITRPPPCSLVWNLISLSQC